MKPLFIFCFLSLLVDFLNAQDSISIDLPEGVYYTREDFIARQAIEIPKIRKLNMGVPSSQAFKDTLVEHCMFLDGKNDPLKKVFAVVHKGMLYFPELAIRHHMIESYRISGLTQGVEFHRVQDWGKYLYLEVTYSSDDKYLVSSMGMMFGALGAIAASALQTSSTLETPVIYDTGRNVFLGLFTPRQLQLFMDSYHPEIEFDAKSPKLHIEDMRKLIQDLNKT